MTAYFHCSNLETSCSDLLFYELCIANCRRWPSPPPAFASPESNMRSASADRFIIEVIFVIGLPEYKIHFFLFLHLHCHLLPPSVKEYVPATLSVGATLPVASVELIYLFL